MLKIGSNIIEARVDGSLKAFHQDLTAFQGFGLEAVEIPIHGLDAIRNGRLDRRRTAEIKSILADCPLVCSSHSPNPLNLMDGRCSVLQRDVLHASLEFSAELGIQCMVLHPGRYLAEEEFPLRGPLVVPADERRRLLDLEVKVLQEAADAFPEVVIAMENARPYLYHSPYCYAEIPHQLVDQIRAIDRRNVRMTLDFGHLHLAARFYDFDMLAEIKTAAPLIAHCHVHDNFGRSNYCTEKSQTHQIPFGRGDCHMPVGWGTLPFAELLAGFIADYQGLLICELRGRYFAETGEAAANLAVILWQLEALKEGKD